MIMPDFIDRAMVAPCGICCLVCYVHLKKRKSCPGCMSDDTEKKPPRCCNCEIKACTTDRGISHCFLCDDFPCKRIKSLDRSYKERYKTSIVGNGLAIYEKGFDAHLVDVKVRWTCTGCGGIVSLHDRICSECGFDFKVADKQSL